MADVLKIAQSRFFMSGRPRPSATAASSKAPGRSCAQQHDQHHAPSDAEHETQQMQAGSLYTHVVLLYSGIPGTAPPHCKQEPGAAGMQAAAGDRLCQSMTVGAQPCTKALYQPERGWTRPVRRAHLFVGVHQHQGVLQLVL